MAFVGHQDQLDIGQVADGLLGVVKRDDRVGVAVPPAHGRGNVGEAEAPVAAEESAVVDHRLEAAAGGQDYVVDVAEIPDMSDCPRGWRLTENSSHTRHTIAGPAASQFRAVAPR